jgi:POT family proton-dependent oligopeptide transporter
MFLGMLQFWFAKPIFGDIGGKPEAKTDEEIIIPEGDKLNPFSLFDKALIILFTVLSVVWILNDPLDKIGNMPLITFDVFGYDGATVTIVVAVIAFLILLVSRLIRYAPVVRDKMIAVAIFAFFTIFFWASFEQAAGSLAIFAKDYTARTLTGNYATTFKIVDTIVTIVPLAIISWVLFKLFSKTIKKITLSNIILATSFLMIWLIVIYKLNREFSDQGTEVPATWFAILNSLFIIMFAPLFSRWWESKYNPSAAFKYAFGLILLGLGFAFLVYGSSTIDQGAKVASVSMFWLIMAYLFHTLGELCLSPLGLSYLSKLVPGRMIAMMFGIWYIAIAIGNKTAHSLGGMIDQITGSYSMSSFFLIFTLIPIVLGFLAMLLNPLLKRLMHGVR